MDKAKTERNHYLRLGIMAVLSFIAMYVLMYAMVYRFSDVFANLNQVYMAGLMAAPMVIIELFLMRAMFPNRKWNAAIAVAGVLALILFWVLIRQQAAISDKQFLRSMIPHHSGAILMCEKADLRDAQIKKLCESIKSSQQSEIDQMNRILKRLD